MNLKIIILTVNEIRKKKEYTLTYCVIPYTHTHTHNITYFIRTYASRLEVWNCFIHVLPKFKYVQNTTLKNLPKIQFPNLNSSCTQ